MGKYFGTDGFRDEANVDLTVEHAYRVGRFLGWCYRQKMPDKRYRMVIGKGTRRSSYMFEYSLVAGLTASDAGVYLLHVTTTPSVSYVVCTEDFNCGIMISASHNPFYGSGIKVINERDEKLGESVVLEIEKYLDGEATEIPLAERERISRTMDFAAERSRYIGYLISIATCSFKNMKVALDCSNGSASAIAKNVFGALGAEAHMMNNEPNGLNINTNCDSTRIEHLQKFVADEKYDIGFAYGDGADRCIAANKNGRVVNGDSIVYICSKYMKEQGSLFNNTVATTIMSNFGLCETFGQEGIAYVRTAVGDKYVYESMATTGHCLDEGQPGHIIFNKRATTEDSTLASLEVMEVVLEKKQPLDKLTSEVEICPQVLKNVWVESKKTAQDDETVQTEVVRVTRNLGGDGGILLRQSGTKPVVCVMVEAPGIQARETYVDRVI